MCAQSQGSTNYTKCVMVCAEHIISIYEQEEGITDRCHTWEQVPKLLLGSQCIKAWLVDAMLKLTTQNYI